LENRGGNVIIGFILIIIALWTLVVLGFFALDYTCYGIPGAVVLDLVLFIGTVFMLWIFNDKFRYVGKYNLYSIIYDCLRG